MDDLISRQAAIEAMKAARVEDDGTYKWRTQRNLDLEFAALLLETIPPAQPEQLGTNLAEVGTDCISRQQAIDAIAKMMPQSFTPDGSHPADKEIFIAQEAFADCIETIEILPSAQPEQRWIPCGKCIHADGKHRWCKILDRSINEDYFCYWAEPWKEGEADEAD